MPRQAVKSPASAPIAGASVARAPASAKEPARPRFRLTSPTAKQIERALAPKEVQIHCAYVAWTRRMQTKVPALARGFHPANGELRDAKTGAKLTRLGVRPGVLDWCLPVARGGRYGGLWLEFKAPGRKPSQVQQYEIEQLRVEGYCVVVCDDWEIAAQNTLDYLAGKVPA